MKEKFTTVDNQLQSAWHFEEAGISRSPERVLLARVVVAKAVDRDRLLTVLRSVPVRQGVEGWNCVAWVREALELLREDGSVLGTAKLEWAVVRDAVMGYVGRKKGAHRFAGEGGFDMSRVATWDSIEERELVR